MNEIDTSSWELDHIGHAVNELDTHINRFVDVLNATLLDREVLVDQQVEIQFLQVGSTVFELIAPLSGSGSAGNSPLQQFLSKRGEGLHHICFRVRDIRAELELLRTRGLRLIDDVPRPGARNTEIAFVHPKGIGGVLIELCQAHG